MEQLEMNCVVCDNNIGYCRVSAVFSLTDEEEAMTYNAWKGNNNNGKCMFWGKGKKRDTHQT